MGASLLAAAAAALLIAAAAGDAAAFRCGSGLVRAGDSTGKVLMECGPPTYKEGAGSKTKKQSLKSDREKETRERKPASVSGRKTERWFYNCGESDFLYVLTFQNGVLEKEETQGYGKGKSDCRGRK